MEALSNLGRFSFSPLGIGLGLSAVILAATPGLGLHKALSTAEPGSLKAFVQSPVGRGFGLALVILAVCLGIGSCCTLSR